MGFTDDLLTGVATRLAGHSVGVWKPVGVYADAEVGIVLGLPTQGPPALIALSTFDDDAAVESDSVLTLRVHLRAPGPDQAAVDELADAVHGVLHDVWGIALDTLRLVYARRLSSEPPKLDTNGRYQRVDEYELAVPRPSATPTDHPGFAESAVRRKALELQNAVLAIGGLRVSLDPNELLDPPAVLIAPPRLTWEGYCPDGTPTTARFLLYLVLPAAGSQLVFDLLGLAELVAAAVETVPGATAPTAYYGRWNPSATTDLPAYLLEVEVSL